MRNIQHICLKKYLPILAILLGALCLAVNSYGLAAENNTKASAYDGGTVKPLFQRPPPPPKGRQAPLNKQPMRPQPLPQLSSSPLKDTTPTSAQLIRLRFGVYPKWTRIVLDMTKAMPYTVNVLENPPRVVVELPPTTWQANYKNNTMQGNGQGLIKAFRAGSVKNAAGHNKTNSTDGGRYRLVFDMKTHVQLVKSFSLQATANNPARLVLDLSPKSIDIKNLKETAEQTLQKIPPVSAPTSSRDLKSLSAPSSLPLKALENPPPPTQLASVSPSTPVPTLVPPPTPKPNRSLAVVVLDAGHGGIDPGAIAVDGTYEKDITLLMAKKLAAKLQSTGRYTVYLTRDTDTFIPLARRVEIARSKGAQLFISLHADSIDKKGVQGLSIYTLSQNASDKASEKLAARENRSDLIAGVNLTDEGADVANILIDLALRESMNESKHFAQLAVNTLSSKNIRLLPNTHRSAGFAVLKAPDVPSVLIELGYLSNPADVSRLRDKKHQEQLVEALLASIDGYFSRLALLTAH